MLKFLGSVILVASAYYLSGRLGLVLAIPPGYATAIWPASGMALAAAILLRARALPGILIGSFLINFPNSPDLKAPEALLVPLVIAIGAMLQAGLGAGLIRRWVGYRNLLVQELDAVRILLIGGPLACLLNASIGVGCLWMTGKVTLDSVAFNWFTWWVGDSIGVLIFTPLVLIWSIRPYRTWLRQQLLVSTPLVGLFALVVWIFVFISERDQQRLNTEFQAASSQTGDRLREDLGHTLTVLNSIEGYFASADKVEIYQFETFAGRLLPSLPGGVALSWNPVVLDADRKAFEARAYTKKPIFERAPDGSRIPAVPREFYVPVAGIVPLDGSEQAIGYDVWSNPIRRQAMSDARDLGLPRASRRVDLVQQPGTSGVLVYMPIFRNGVQPAAVSSKRQHLEGYAVAVFQLNGLMERVLERSPWDDAWVLELIDASSETERETLFRRGSDLGAKSLGLVNESTVDFAGRQWRLTVRLPETELVQHRSWESWMVLAGGLGFTSLAGMMMLLLTGRGLRVESLVAERTAALRQSESELNRKAQQLVSSNTELEQFAYIASHDLKAPLRSIASFAQLLERRAGSELRPEAREFLGFIRDGVRQMQGLVDDLLRLSRVEAKRLEPQEIELDQIVAQVLKTLAADVESGGAKIHSGPLPSLVGDPRMLAQLFQNLISNGIKFQAPGTTPEVWISAKATGDDISIEVRDNGIGVESRFLEHIFQLFKRLHTADQYAGTGIGLAICRKVVQLHGGEIRADSAPGQGLTVRFSLARTPPSW